MKQFNEKVTLSLNDFKKYNNDDNYEFSYGVIDFLSTRPNSHRFIFTEDVIREYAPTVLGKWMIGEYAYGDMSSHTQNQTIQGIIPINQEVQYRYDEDGYFVASVKVILSKLYAQASDVLRNGGNYRSVSLEALMGFSEETENLETGLYDKEVIGFNITAITILGQDVNPSIPKSNIILTQMSEDMIQRAEKEFVKFSQESELEQVSLNDIMLKLNSIENKLIKEDIMPNQELNEVLEETNLEETELQENVNSEETVVETETECEKQEMAETQEELSENSENEAEEVEETELAEDKEETEEQEMGECEKQEMAELVEKLSQAEAKLAEYEATISECQKVIASLESFKKEIDDKNKEAIVSATLSKIKDYVDQETFSAYEKSGEECSIDNVGGWRNEALAFIAEKAIAKMSEKEEGILDLGMPQETKVSSVWDKYK